MDQPSSIPLSLLATAMHRSAWWLGTLGLALTTGLSVPSAIADATETGADALQIQSQPPAPVAPAPAAIPAPQRPRAVIAPPPAVPNPRPKRSPNPVTIPSAPVVTPPASIPSATGSGFIDRSKGFDLGATQPVGDVQFSTRGAGGSARAGGVLPGGTPASYLGRLRSGASGLPPLPDAPASVRIGPLSVSAKGIGLGSNFFFRTERPKGIAGNNDQGFVFPLSVPSAISSSFGWRTHPILGYRRFHAGTDFAAPMGTPVTAVLSGKVTWANFLGGYGLAVGLEHKDGTQKTLYSHLSEIFVKPGDRVKQGDVIGRVGSTGLSTGPHLHFEVREFRNGGWVALDPGKFLASVGTPMPLTDEDIKDDPFEFMMTRLIAAMEKSHKKQYDGEDLVQLKAAEARSANGLVEPKLIPADLGPSDAIDTPRNQGDRINGRIDNRNNPIDAAPRNIRRPRISP